MVTPFSFIVESVLVLDFALAFDAAAVAVLVSITDAVVVFGEGGAGLLALLAVVGAGGFTATGFAAAGFAGSFFDSTLRTAVLLADAPGLPADSGAGLVALLAATGFFAIGVFLLATLDLATGAGFALVAVFGATFLTGFAASFGFTAALAAGLARATTLVDLAVDLDFCVDFAISVLTPS